MRWRFRWIQPSCGVDCRGRTNKNPMQKGAGQQIWSAPSIYCKYSTATSCKFDAPVSGGAYQDARKVTIVRNARRKHRFQPEIRCRMHQTVTKRPFLPYLFPRKGKDRAAGGASETTTAERAAASDVSYPLCSFLPFQTAN